MSSFSRLNIKETLMKLLIFHLEVYSLNRTLAYGLTMIVSQRKIGKHIG